MESLNELFPEIDHRAAGLLKHSLDQPFIDKVVIGVNTKVQLERNLLFLEETNPLNLESPETPEEIVFTILMETMSELQIKVDGKIILITGGYGYLGKAIVRSLVQHGARVYVLGRDIEKFKKAFPEYANSNKSSIEFLYVDILNEQSIIEAFTHFGKEGLKISGLINNAFHVEGPFGKIGRAEFTSTLDGSLTSIYDFIRHSEKHLAPEASIVNVSSMYGMVPPDFDAYKDAAEMTNPPHYGAAKAGVIQLTKYYASLFGKRGIRVNAVSPGPFPNDQVQQNTQFIAELEKRTLLGRIGKPAELAGVFTFLMSDASRYITGQNLVVDGGWTVR